jgi:hypothetical protein
VKFQPLLESAPGEFVGRSAEEAVDRARSVLGAEAKIRCWKTRRGGVLGFFAREVFIAGVKAPDGTSKAATRTEEPAIPRSLADAMSPTFDELVAATSDEVSVGADDAAVEDHAFRDVLAQAEAALNDAVFDDAAWISEEAASASAAANDPIRSELDAFRASLESLGLPVAYRPSSHESVLDGLVRSIASLPTPPALPLSVGSVIAVVGSRRDARAVAQEIAVTLDLDESDVIVSSDDPAVRRRIARRKRSARVSVVVLEAAVRGRTFEPVRAELERMAPDYVLGVVAATLKCADVDRWRSELRVDALALRHWDETETPAELLAALPVYSVDGAVMSTMRWVSLLISTFVDRTDATA